MNNKKGIDYNCYNSLHFTTFDDNNWDPHNGTFDREGYIDYGYEAFEYLKSLTKKVKNKLSKTPTDEYMFKLFKEKTGFPIHATEKLVSYFLKLESDSRSKYYKKSKTKNCTTKELMGYRLIELPY